MNRKVLSTATKELNKAKAPARPKDILFDPTGQGMLNPKYAGKPVRLATDTLYNPTKYNIRAYSDNGVSARLNPYDTTNVTLEGAKYIDEYPELQEGGIYMDGDLSQEEIDYYAKGGYVIEDISVPELANASDHYYDNGGPIKKGKTKNQINENLGQHYKYPGNKNEYLKQGDKWYISNNGTDFKFIPINDPNGKRTAELNKHAILHNTDSKEIGLEGKISRGLNNSMTRASRAAEYFAPKGEDPTDNFRHPMAGRYVTEAIAEKSGHIPYISNFVGALGANALGIAHEASTLFTDKRPWAEKWKEAKEDTYNNFVGSVVGASSLTPKEKTAYLNYLSTQHKIPDGYGAIHPFHNDWQDPYTLRHKEGGALLTKKVTCKSCGWTWDAADGGDDVTTCHKCGGQGLIHAQKGQTIKPLEISDPKEFAYRNKMYADSSNLYKAYQMQDKLMGPGNYKTKDKYKWNTAELKEGRRKKIMPGLSYPIAADFQSEADQFKNGYNTYTARKEDKQLLDYYKKLGFKPNQIMYHSSPDLVNDKIKAVGSYFDGNAISPIYKKPIQPVVFKEIVENQTAPVVQETVTPVKIVQSSQEKVVTPVVQPKPTTPSKPTAYRSQTVMYPDGTYELRRVPYYEGNDKGTWTQGTKLNPPGVINATDLSPEEQQTLKNKNKLNSKKEGGIISKLNKKQIQDLIEQGYVIEEQ